MFFVCCMLIVFSTGDVSVFPYSGRMAIYIYIYIYTALLVDRCKPTGPGCIAMSNKYRTRFSLRRSHNYTALASTSIGRPEFSHFGGLALRAFWMSIKEGPYVRLTQLVRLTGGHPRKKWDATLPYMWALAILERQKTFMYCPGFRS
jgi:hypothetical protein